MSSGLDLENQYCAHNYHPLPVVLTRGEGVYLWDENDKKYLDMMSAYSAVSHGHSNPRVVDALKQQAETLCIVICFEPFVFLYFITAVADKRYNAESEVDHE